MEEILVPIALFAIIPVTVWAITAYRHKSHSATMSVLKTMATNNETITPEIIKTLGVRRRPKHADLRLGLILVAVAVSMVIFGTVIPDEDSTEIFRGLASFPFLVGLVFIGLWFAVSRKSED